MGEQALWDLFQEQLCRCETIGLSLDLSRMGFAPDFFDRMAPQVAIAREAMEALENGAIANPDENRMVGHYWLRDPNRAPSAEITNQILSMQKRVNAFASEVHAGSIKPPLLT